MPRFQEKINIFHSFLSNSTLFGVEFAVESQLPRFQETIINNYRTTTVSPPRYHTLLTGAPTSTDDGTASWVVVVVVREEGGGGAGLEDGCSRSENRLATPPEDEEEMEEEGVRAMRVGTAARVMMGVSWEELLFFLWPGLRPL